MILYMLMETGFSRSFPNAERWLVKNGVRPKGRGKVAFSGSNLELSRCQGFWTLVFGSTLESSRPAVLWCCHLPIGAALILDTWLIFKWLKV